MALQKRTLSQRAEARFRSLWARTLPIPRVQSPIFILGTVRSGTTYLAQCLGSHPQISYVGFELNDRWSQVGEIPIAGTDTTDAHCPYLGGSDVSTLQIQNIRREFNRLLFLKSGWSETRLLNKNPHLWNKVGVVQAAFPDARFIITARDLMSIVASTKLLWDKIFDGWKIKHYLPVEKEACWSCSPPLSDAGLEAGRTFPGGDVTVLAEYWLRVYETLEHEFTDKETAIVVNHQEFLDDTTACLKRISDVCDLSFAAFKMPKPLDRERNSRWREILSKDEVEAVEGFVGANSHRISCLKTVKVKLL